MPKSKILLIEDEEDTVSLYKTALSEAGFTVVAINSAEDALSRAEKEKPDLILLDLMLPGKSGFEVLESLKKNRHTKDTPVLALTNLAEEVGFERAVAKGAAGYIVKAERTPRQVCLLLRQVLEEHRVSQ